MADAQTAFTPIKIGPMTLRNRFIRSGANEGMTPQGVPTKALVEHHRAMAKGGVGMTTLAYGSISREGLTFGHQFIVNAQNLPHLRVLTDAVHAEGAAASLQITHAGAFTQTRFAKSPWTPPTASGGFNAAGVLSGIFSQHTMDEAEMRKIAGEFAAAAVLAREGGFDAVEIHMGHGYLLSQFLSPLSNQRSDRWGGSLENRARLLLSVVKAIRAVVSADFCVAIKLNSADFQRGGFDADDARQVIEWLNDLPVDLVELSGGSYEAPAMQGEARDGRTLAREAYFMEMAGELAKVAKMPVMVTGGIRRLPIVEQVLDSGIAMAGIGTALAVEPHLPRHWREGRDSHPQLPPIHWKKKPLAALANMAVVKFQLQRLSKGKRPHPEVSAVWALVLDRLFIGRRTKQYRAAMKNLSA